MNTNALKYALVGLCGFLASLLVCFAFIPAPDRIVGKVQPSPNVVPMPLVLDSQPSTQALFWGAPQEDRGDEYRRFLSASVKINVTGGSGSGTIVYHEPKTGEAYVASCGHLWDGNRSATDLLKRPKRCKVVVWYHNGSKLPAPKEYEADVLFWSNVRGFDSSLVKFRPDWVPVYFPIAPVDYVYVPGARHHSLGCDGGREVARYDVEVVGLRNGDLITTRNSPRPGRSGGGLLSDDGFYIATCWGTSDTTGGSGIGYFTPLSSIHKVYRDNGYGWLLDVGQGLARRIPIHDRLRPGQRYPPDYIELPSAGGISLPPY